MSRISFFVAAILSSICTSGRADIFFDDFEAEGVFTITQNNYNNFINWTVSDGTVDIEPKLLAPNSRRIVSGMDGFGNIVDLDGSSSNAGKLTSRALFNLQPGQYSLAFDMAGSWPTNPAASTTDSVNVSLGTLFSEVYVINSTNTVQTYVRIFDVSSLASAPIIFDHDGGGQLRNSARQHSADGCSR